MGWIRQQAETPVLIQPFLYSAYRSRQAVLAGNLLTDQIRPIYFKYLAAFGSVLISSIYGVVDAAMVGQYQGPTGTAALAVVAPVWNIIYSLGLLTGIGGSVLFSTMRGQAADNEKKSNEYFSAAVIGTVILAALTWVAVIFFDRQFLTLFGAEETLLPLAREYLFPIKFVVPSFLFTQLMSVFLRNDGDPALGPPNRCCSAAVFGVVWTLAAELVPNGFVRIFITPTDSILSIAPGIIRRYGISFLLLPFSIFSTYYLQAMMKPSTAFVVSVSRGAVISGILIYLLPVIAGASGIWFAMPITELVVAVFMAVMMRRCQKQPIR